MRVSRGGSSRLLRLEGVWVKRSSVRSAGG